MLFAVAGPGMLTLPPSSAAPGSAASAIGVGPLEYEAPGTPSAGLTSRAATAPGSGGAAGAGREQQQRPADDGELERQALQLIQQQEEMAIMQLRQQKELERQRAEEQKRPPPSAPATLQSQQQPLERPPVRVIGIGPAPTAASHQQHYQSQQQQPRAAAVSRSDADLAEENRQLRHALLDSRFALQQQAAGRKRSKPKRQPP